MVNFLNYFVDPAKRQNFGSALAEICIPVLRVRHMAFFYIVVHGRMVLSGARYKPAEDFQAVTPRVASSGFLLALQHKPPPNSLFTFQLSVTPLIMGTDVFGVQ